MDDADTFTSVFQQFLEWCDHECNLSGTKCMLVTCGDWDLNTMLPSQCALSKVALPEMAKCWIDIKSEFERLQQKQIVRSEINFLEQMCRHFKIPDVVGGGGRLGKVRRLAEVVKRLRGGRKGARWLFKTSHKSKISFPDGRMPQIEPLQYLAKTEKTMHSGVQVCFIPVKLLTI